MNSPAARLVPAGVPAPAGGAAIRVPPRRRRRLRWLVVGLLALAAVSLGAVKGLERRQNTRKTRDEITTYAVERGALHVTVAESGTLKAKRSERIFPDIPGNAKVAWLVDEGVTVESGDVLAVMETEELEKQIADSQIQLQQAVSARIQAEEQLAIQGRQNESDLQAAQVRLQIAQLELQRYQEGEQPKLLREAKLKLEKAEVNRRLAEEDLAGMEDYVAKGYFTRQDLEQRKLTLREALDNLETARKDLELLEKFQIPKDLAQRQSDVEQAQTNSDLVERKAKSELAKKQADLQERTFVEKLRQERLATLQDLLKRMTLRAPQKGLVIYGDDRSWWRRDEVKVGMNVSRGTVLMTLPDLDEMEVQVSINEVDLDKVERGQRASITLDAYPTLAFAGTVTKVGRLAERGGRWGGSDIKTFEVIVEMDMAQAQRALAAGPSRSSSMPAASPNGGRLRPGMSAKVEIDVATLTDTLYVPLDAVFEDRGGHFCHVLEGGEPVLRRVEIGLNSRTHVAVTKGLTAGERVLRYDPRRLPGRRPSATQPAQTRPWEAPAALPADKQGEAARPAPTTAPAARSATATRPARPPAPQRAD